MNKQNLQAKFDELVSKGAVAGSGTSYFTAAAAIPTSGTDAILATDENTIKLELSNTGTIVVYYKTQNGLWISKNTLFGRHYTESKGDFEIAQILCRTSGSKPAGTVETIYAKDRAGNTVPVNIFCFTQNVPVTFSSRTTGYLPIVKDAWDATNRRMRMHREISQERPYALLTLG